MNRSQIVRAGEVATPVLLLIAALAFAATDARSEEHDKSAALAAKLRSEQPLSRGEYEAAESNRASAMDEQFETLAKLLKRLDERLAKLDERIDRLDGRLAKIEKAVKP